MEIISNKIFLLPQPENLSKKGAIHLELEAMRANAITKHLVIKLYYTADNLIRGNTIYM